MGYPADLDNATNLQGSWNHAQYPAAVGLDIVGAVVAADAVAVVVFAAAAAVTCDAGVVEVAASRCHHTVRRYGM